jgi:hypothetical protein
MSHYLVDYFEVSGFVRSVDTMGGGAQLCKTSKAGAAEVVVVPAKVGQL